MRFETNDPETRLLDEGTLEIRFRPPFSGTLRVTSWSDGLRILHAEDGHWIEDPHDPQLAFIGSALRTPNAGAAHDFARTIPADAVRLSGTCGTFELTALRMLRWHDAA